MFDAPHIELREELCGIGEVAAPGDSGEVRIVRAHRPVVRVGADEHVESCALESQREATGATEEVDGGRSGPRCLHEVPYRLKVSRVRTSWVPGRSGGNTAMVGDWGAPPRICCRNARLFSGALHSATVSGVQAELMFAFRGFGADAAEARA